MAHRFQHPLWLVVLLLMSPWTALADSPSIVMLGDSTTARRQGIEKVYARRVHEALHRDGIAASVTNAGVPGDTTNGARARFKKDVLAHRPDLVVIQLGANDSAIDVWKDPPSTAPRVPLARFEKNLRWMIGQLKKRDIAVVLMTTNHFRWTPYFRVKYGKPPYDPNDAMSFTNTSLRRYNESTRRIAKEENVPLVDVLQAYDDYEAQTGKSPDTLLLDGMHPNDVGHQLVTERLLPVLRKTLGK